MLRLALEHNDFIFLKHFVLFMVSIIIMLILMAITSVYSRWSCYLSNRHEKNGKRAKRTDNCWTIRFTFWTTQETNMEWRKTRVKMEGWLGQFQITSAPCRKDHDQWKSMGKTSNDGRTVYEWLRHTHSARVFKFMHRNMRLVYHANEL